jgi:hypothetical protein
MKFYKYNNPISLFKIISYKLSCIFTNNIFVAFIKNGEHHNTRNASYLDIFKCKLFCLNSESYGPHFTKQS